MNLIQKDKLTNKNQFVFFHEMTIFIRILSLKSDGIIIAVNLNLNVFLHASVTVNSNYFCGNERLVKRLRLK